MVIASLAMLMNLALPNEIGNGLKTIAHQPKLLFHGHYTKRMFLIQPHPHVCQSIKNYFLFNLTLMHLNTWNTFENKEMTANAFAI